MFWAKRDETVCQQYRDGTVQCFDNDSFWYTDKGIIVKWSILAGLFGIFMLWFVGGYIHAKMRLKKGLPLLGYHRFLISYSERKRHGQVPQNHFTFYQTQNPYYQYQQQPYQQRQDGTYAEPPPQYFGNDAPPQYFGPPGGTKMNPNQQHGGPQMEMPQYGAPQGHQQTGVVGEGSSSSAPQQGPPPENLPPRPQQAKAAIKGVLDRFRK